MVHQEDHVVENVFSCCNLFVEVALFSINKSSMLFDVLQWDSADLFLHFFGTICIQSAICWLSHKMATFKQKWRIVCRLTLKKKWMQVSGF